LIWKKAVGVVTITSLLLSLGLSGCERRKVYSEDAYVTTGALEAEISSCMPVLCIQTKLSASDSLSFIDDPVATHVAKSIASWTPHYQMPPAPYYVDCRVSLLGKNQESLLENCDAQVKVRGNWTSSYDKKPLHIKFAEKQNLLGMSDGNEYKDWVLLAEYKDASMLRDKTAFQIANEILGADGLYATDAEFVSVVVNGDYRGVYLLVEQQEINKGRVNITKAEEGYTGTDIGYFFELDCYFRNEEPLQRFHISYADNSPLTPYDGEGGHAQEVTFLPTGINDVKDDSGFTIKSKIYSKEQNEFLASYVENVYRILYFAAYEHVSYVFNEDYTEISKTDAITPREAVERVVDLDFLADTYLISEITCDADLYWSSFYLSVDFGEKGNRKLTFQAPWDFDSGLGNKNRCVDGTGYYAGNQIPDVNGYTDYGGKYYTINPWMAVLCYQDWFWEIVRAKWTKAFDNGVFDRALEMILEDTEQYASEYTRNYDKWNNIVNNKSFVGELSQAARNCRTQAEAADYLYSWLESRVEFLNNELHN